MNYLDMNSDQVQAVQRRALLLSSRGYNAAEISEHLADEGSVVPVAIITPMIRPAKPARFARLDINAFNQASAAELRRIRGADRIGGRTSLALVLRIIDRKLPLGVHDQHCVCEAVALERANLRNVDLAYFASEWIKENG